MEMEKLQLPFISIFKSFVVYTVVILMPRYFCVSSKYIYRLAGTHLLQTDQIHRTMAVTLMTHGFCDYLQMEM